MDDGYQMRPHTTNLPQVKPIEPGKGTKLETRLAEWGVNFQGPARQSAIGIRDT